MTRRNINIYLLVLPLLIVALAALSIRIFCSFTFPIPWSDESDFIAPAFELSRNGSLFVYGMNPDRVVMWMPPGYMIILAGIFKIFGYSFEAARWFSTVLFIAAYGAALAITRRCLDGLHLIIAISASVLAFVSPYSLAISNIARMESLYVFMLLSALVVTVNNRPGIGFAIVLATAIVHFNAIYFVIPYVAYFFSCLPRRQFNFSRSAVIAFAVAGILLAMYVGYVAKNWTAFMQDMRFQFWVKSWGPAFFGIKGKVIVALTYAAVILQWVIQRRFSSAIFVSAYGAGFVLLYIYGQNMWYTFGESVGYFLLIVGFLLTLNERASAIQSLALCLFCAISFVALMYFSFFRITPQFAPLWLRAELLNRDFISHNELRKVSNFLKSTPAGQRFCFGHSGIEPFFFQQLADQKLIWLYKVYSVTQVQPFRNADYIVRCDSALLPRYVLKFEIGKFPREGRDTGCDILAAQDGTL